MTFRPADAPALELDNEPDDIHSDGIQVHLGDGSGKTWGVLMVPEADGTAFAANWYDFDIVEAAARAVVDAKGTGTTVAALANPDAALTVFAPNDRTFQVLARELTGKWYGTEAGVGMGPSNITSAPAASSPASRADSNM